MEQPITYVGLDVHKETIAVALAEAGVRRDVREHGKIANTAAGVTALAAKLARGGNELRFCDQPSLHDRASCPAQSRTP
jgi:hypothetical protein